MSLTVPATWSVNELNTGAVNISKEGYILYINPDISQASGVEGGRFSEIAQGSPSADLVIKNWPDDPCGTAEKSSINTKLKRTDYFVNKNNVGVSSNCNAPANGSAWYFSYVTTPDAGYFASKKEFTGSSAYNGLDQFVITMSYKTSDVNNLPKEDSEARENALDEMSAMLTSLKLK